MALPDADSPWGNLPGTAVACMDALLDAAAQRARDAFRAPRDFAAACRFLIDELGEETVLLYGAGTHSAALLATPVGPRVSAIIDREGRDGLTFHGLPVLSPAQAAAAPGRIAVAHPLWEPDMCAALADAGVVAARILKVYSNPRFAARVLADAYAHVAERIPRPVHNVVIGSGRWAVVSDVELSHALPPTSTVKLHFDFSEPFLPSLFYDTIDMSKSLALLEYSLRRLDPKVIYLRTQILTTFVVHTVRKISPGARLVHEPYDFASLMTDDVLQDWLNHGPEAVELCRLAELYSIKNSDLLVSKRSGALWNAALGPGDAPYRCYYGGMPNTPSPAPFAAHRPVRIIYAGILPRPEHIGRHRSDYSFLPVLEELGRARVCEVALYNFLHQGTEADEVYARYLERYAEGPMRYHRALPYDELLRVASAFDYGWLYCPMDGPGTLDRRSVVGQRFTGYIFAGLPVVIDDGWHAMCELVREYGAGIIVPGNRPDLLAAEIGRHDHAALQAGVRRLRAAMMTHNASVLDDIAALQ